jgi:TonB family protein
MIALALLLAAQAAVPADTPVRPIVETMMLAQEDYPLDSLRNDERGTVRLLLEIGTDGRVSGCRIHSSTATPRLEAQSCTIALARFRFHPATRAGVAVAATAILPLDWQTHDGAAPPPPR